MNTNKLERFMIVLITVVYSLTTFSYKAEGLDSILTKEKFAADLVKNKKEYYHKMKDGDIEGAEKYLQNVFDLRHKLDEQCDMDSLVLVEYNECLNNCMVADSDFLEAEKACAVTEEYAIYIIGLSFRMQDQIREQRSQGNQNEAYQKARELNYIGNEIERLDDLYPEFDKNSSKALFYYMLMSF